MYRERGIPSAVDVTTMKNIFRVILVYKLITSTDTTL